MPNAQPRAARVNAAPRAPRLKDLSGGDRAGYIAEMIREMRRLADGPGFGVLRERLLASEEEARRIAG